MRLIACRKWLRRGLLQAVVGETRPLVSLEFIGKWREAVGLKMVEIVAETHLILHSWSAPENASGVDGRKRTPPRGFEAFHPVPAHLARRSR